MVVAVVNEETYFRGLILKTLRIKGVGYAVIISAAFFGLVHLGSLTAGREIEQVLLLVGYAFLFGIVSAEIVIITRSILVPAIWHFATNILSSVTAEAAWDVTLLIVAVQSVLLCLYAVYLWRAINKVEYPD